MHAVTTLQDKQCDDQKFAITRLDAYQEEYVGGGERRGHITVSLFLFNSVKDVKPYKVVIAIAIGKSDYGHSNPLKNAISKVGKALREKLED